MMKGDHGPTKLLHAYTLYTVHDIIGETTIIINFDINF